MPATQPKLDEIPNSLLLCADHKKLLYPLELDKMEDEDST